MDRTIKNLEIIGIVNDKLNANHDVIVELSDSKKYTATFFTLVNLQYLLAYYEQSSGECNNGTFFWASDMCIIKAIDEKLIREAITTMLKDHYFENVFKLLEN
jgi:hypothetical protein